MGYYTKCMATSEDIKGFTNGKKEPGTDNMEQFERYICHSCGNLVEPGIFCSACGREFTEERDDAFKSLGEAFIDDSLICLKDAATKEILGCPKCNNGFFYKLFTKNLVKCERCGVITSYKDPTLVEYEKLPNNFGIYGYFVFSIPSEKRPAGVVHWEVYHNHNNEKSIYIQYDDGTNFIFSVDLEKQTFLYYQVNKAFMPINPDNGLRGKLITEWAEMGQKNRLAYLRKRNEKINDWIRFYANHDIKVTSESYFMNTIIMHVNHNFEPSDLEDIVSRWPGMEPPSYWKQMREEVLLENNFIKRKGKIS